MKVWSVLHFHLKTYTCPYQMVKDVDPPVSWLDLGSAAELILINMDFNTMQDFPFFTSFYFTNIHILVELFQNVCSLTTDCENGYKIVPGNYR